MQGLSRRSAAILISVSVLLTSAAQLLFRFAMKQVELVPSAGWALFASVIAELSTPGLLILGLGVLLYGVSMVVWIAALTRYPVSLAYPMLSISYVLVFVAATQLTALNESASLAQGIGVAIIVLGVCCLSLEARQKRIGDGV